MFKKVTGILLAASFALSSGLALAEDALPTKTVAQLYAEKDQLAGQRVEISGEVVKVNNDIMGKNFIHLRDGTGAEGSNDVTVTSQDTAEVGDKITVDAKVVTGRDFGMGYTYELILEEAKIHH